MPQYRRQPRPGHQFVAYTGGAADGAVVEMPDQLADRPPRIRIMSNGAVYYERKPYPVPGARLIKRPSQV
jgi:hypothetical protein